MANFSYEENELPQPAVGYNYLLKNGDTVTYYNVGEWSMSEHPEEDGNIEKAKAAVLAWIAWYNFLNDKDVENV